MLVLAGIVALALRAPAVSPRIPCVGEGVSARVVVVNTGSEPLKDVTVRAEFLTEFGHRVSAGVQKIPQIPPQAEHRVVFPPVVLKEAVGHFCEFSAAVGSETVRLKYPFAVTRRKVHFAWFDTPKGLRWATISTAIRKEEVDLWLWEGRIPLAWKGGVCFWKCHPKASVEDQVRCWSSVDEGVMGIGVDEWLEHGEYSEIAPKLADAIVRFKRENPTKLLALWNIPSDRYLGKVREAVDFFLPEVYLNYRGMHLGALESALRRIEAAGLLNKTLVGLGINYELDKPAPAKTTPSELAEQMRLIKRLAPNIAGVGFFYFSAAPEGLPQVADELCYQLFVAPVLQVRNLQIHGNTTQSLRIHFTLANIGNMDAAEVKCGVRSDQRTVSSEKVRILRAGEAKSVRVPVLGLHSGFHLLQPFASAGREVVTFLDPQAPMPVFVANSPQAKSKFRFFWIQPAPIGCENVPVHIKLEPQHLVTRVERCGKDGRVVQALDFVQRGSTVTFVLPSVQQGEPVYLRLSVATQEKSPLKQTPQTVRGKFVFENAFYRAVLDTDEDAIVELAPHPSAQNLFSSPWKLEAGDLRPSGEATVVRTTVLTEVTVSLAGSAVKGFSLYRFYEASPVIEIERRIVPQKPWQIQGAREGAGFPQHGGTYQAWAGEGALRVSRGSLMDTSDYRDLYFGYLGDEPAPSNCDKTGWFDFSWGKGLNAGLGIAVVKRWVDSKSSTYDVTRYYDAADRVDIYYVYGSQCTIQRPQESLVVLLPHAGRDLSQPDAIAPIQPVLWVYRNRPSPVHCIVRASK